MSTELIVFDYGQLDVETRIVVQQRASEIKTLMKRTAQDIIEIGGKLLDVKEKLNHGEFGVWLDKEFGWSQGTARRYMSVALNIGQIDHGDRFDAKALYLLAAPSTPEPARIEAIQRAEAGEAITHSVARGIVTEHKPQPTPQPSRRDYNTTLDNALEEMEREIDQILTPATAPNYWTPEPAEAEAEAEPTPQPSRPHVVNNSGNNEWYTPATYIEAARQVLGKIELDPASSATANDVVQAEEYYDIADDGLTLPWSGKIWLNPPYGRDLIAPFIEKLCRHASNGEIEAAIVLVNNATETDWFQTLAAHADALCFPRSRIRYWNAYGTHDSPLQGQAFAYIGDNKALFSRVFSQFGIVLSEEP